jgi:16S rRNA (guanine527-N7)-methyltransferase
VASGAADAAREAEAISSGAKGLGVELDGAAVEDLLRYLATLRTWAPRMDLISTHDLAVAVDRHLIDSLAAARLLRELERPLRIADVGSGAGLPGVPLAIAVRPEAMLLVEPRHRRASFLREVARTQPRTRIAVANQRVEDLAPDVAGTFDAVVSRAALQPSDLFAAGKRLLRAGGLLVAYRGAAQDRPGSSAEPAAALWTAEPSIAYRIPGSAMEFRLDAWRLGAA